MDRCLKFPTSYFPFYQLCLYSKLKKDILLLSFLLLIHGKIWSNSFCLKEIHQQIFSFRSSLLLFSMIISISKFDKLLLSIITQITRFYNVLHNYVLKYLQKSLFGSFVFESCHHDWPVLSFFQLFDQHLKNQCIDCFWFANAIKWIYHFSKMNIIAYCSLHF